VDEGTSMPGDSTTATTNYQPEFHLSELSYAERLMVKANRRAQIPELGSDHLRGTQENGIEEGAGKPGFPNAI